MQGMNLDPLLGHGRLYLCRLP